MKTILTNSIVIPMAAHFIFLACEWLILFYFAFHMLEQNYGGLISSIAFLAQTILRLACSKYISITLHMKSVQFKIGLSLFLKAILIVLFGFLPPVSQNALLTLLFIYIIQFILITDNYTLFDIKYHYHQTGLLSLNKYVALSNLGKRGSVALGSFVTTLIGLHQWGLFSYILIFTAVCGIIAVALNALILQYPNPSNENASKEPINNQQSTYDTLAPAITFFSAYLLIMNGCFGALSLLLARATADYDLATSLGLNIITLFYTGFIVFNLFAIRFEQQLQSLYTTKLMVSGTALLALFILGIAFHTDAILIAFVFSFLGGSCYGATLNIFAVITLKRIQGSSAAMLFAKIEHYGRLGFLSSFTMMGLLIDHISSAILLSFIGVLGIIGFVILNLKRHQQQPHMRGASYE